MAKTFHVATGELEHGIEFIDEDGKKYILTISNGRRNHVPFCSDPKKQPRRVTALTLLDGELHQNMIQNEDPRSIVILVHVVGAKEIEPKSDGVIVHGKELALVQLIPGTSILVHGAKGQKFYLCFDRGQLIQRAA